MAGTEDPPPSRPGRLPHLLLIPGLQQRVVDAVKAGNYIDAAAGYAGVNRATLYTWMHKGRAERARLIANPGSKPRQRQKLYLDFVEAVDAARAEAECRVVAQIQSAIPDSWQAGAWWLERTNPKRWGRVSRLALTGGDGGPLQVDVDVSVRQELITRIAQMTERLAPVEADDIVDADVVSYEDNGHGHGPGPGS